MIQFAAMTEKGVPPVAGGALDQANQFIEACTFIWSEQRRHRSELGIPWWMT